MSIFIIAGPDDCDTFGKTIGAFFDQREVHVWGGYEGTWALNTGWHYTAGPEADVKAKEDIPKDRHAALIFVPKRDRTKRIISLGDLR